MRRLVAFAFVLFCAASLAQGGAVAQDDLTPQQIGVVEEIEPVTTPDFEPEELAKTTFWQQEFERAGTEALRLRFGDIIVPADSTAQLIIQDGAGEIVETWEGPDIAKLAGQWSLPVRGDRARVALVGDKTPTGLKLTIDALARQIAPGVMMSIIGNSELEPIAAYAGSAQVVRLALPVAKLEFVEGGSTFVCTGFLIGRDRLMTNHHCVSTQATCRTTSATFGYQRRTDGTLQRGTSIRCIQLVAQNRKLDFAVLQLATPAGDTFGTLKLVPDSGLGVETPLFIIEHPAGRPKEISFRECAVTTPEATGRAEKSDFGHRCDTEGGSSGSPVFNATGLVVGLHHFGVGEGAFADQNRAVRMSRILACLDTNNCP